MSDGSAAWAIVYGNHPGTWRPSLEEIAPDDFAQLTLDVAAENARRGFRLDEALQAQLSDIEGRLVRKFREWRSVTEREHDYQWAEALSVAWAERAAVLAKGGEPEPAWWLDVVQCLRGTLVPTEGRYFVTFAVSMTDGKVVDVSAVGLDNQKKTPAVRAGERSQHDDWIDDYTR